MIEELMNMLKADRGPHIEVYLVVREQGEFSTYLEKTVFATTNKVLADRYASGAAELAKAHAAVVKEATPDDPFEGELDRVDALRAAGTPLDRTYKGETPISYRVDTLPLHVSGQ